RRSGILWPEEGYVRYKGKALSKMSEKELFFHRGKTGFAFQDAALWSNLTVFQNLYLPLQFHRHKAHPRELEQRILSLAKEYGLEGDLQLRPAQLSAGKRILVSFVRSIVLDPDILFLDEPTTFLDNLTVDRILRTLKQMKKEGKTLLIATHSPELTSQLADRLVVMKGGSILEAGPVQQVVRSRNPLVIEIISEVLSEAAVYDTDILELLQED
ncbi:MAG: ATP-binding cassette domain-containing protein, partial [Spirochaetales bacterium]